LYICSQAQAASPNSLQPDHPGAALERVEGAAHGGEQRQVRGRMRQVVGGHAGVVQHLARLFEEDLAHLGVVLEIRRWPTAAGADTVGGGGDGRDGWSPGPRPGGWASMRLLTAPATPSAVGGRGAGSSARPSRGRAVIG
jgi:hypothetical protein